MQWTSYQDRNVERQARMDARVWGLNPGGTNRSNRKGFPLCPDWQLGKCRTLPCPLDARNVRPCKICLSGRHGAGAYPLQPLRHGLGARLGNAWQPSFALQSRAAAAVAAWA